LLSGNERAAEFYNNTWLQIHIAIGVKHQGGTALDSHVAIHDIRRHMVSEKLFFS